MHRPVPAPKSQRRAQEYEPEWARILEIIERRIAAGERHLSRVVSLVHHEWRDTGFDAEDGVSLGAPVRMPRSVLFDARQSLIARAVLDACRPDTAAIVELGSGHGLNLCDIYCRGGPARATYFGLELTGSGRRCLETLSALDQEFKCQSLFFDFNAPDLGPIRDVTGHLVVFTVHSIEQIPNIGSDLFRTLVGAADSVSGVHLEPVGWQVSAPRDSAFSTREYAERRGYNLDLFEVLQGLHQDGLLTIENAVPDAFSHKLKNASTLIRWSNRAPA